MNPYKIIILPFILSAILLGLLHSEQQLARADDTEIKIIHDGYPVFESVKHLFGIPVTSGYTTQLPPQKFMHLGDTLTLKTKHRVSFEDRLTLVPTSRLSYHWWEKENTNNWKENNTNSPDIHIKPNTTGKFWYQLSTQYSRPWIIHDFIMNSEISEINVLANVVNADSLTVDTDDDYLFNSNNPLVTNSTLAHAMPSPLNTTEPVHWSSSDKSLAIVDEDGYVTAVSSEKSGPVKIIGTIFNKDENKTIITGSKTIRVGGGLDNQKVHMGETATFDFQANQKETKISNGGTISVEWHQIHNKIDKKISTLTNPSNISLTTPINNLDNNCDHYYAIIRLIHKNKKNEEFQTNCAKLTVLPSKMPNVDVTTKVTNLTDDKTLNYATELHNVTIGDQISYQTTLMNKSVHLIHNSKLEFPLYQNSNIDQIKINGEPLSPEDYSLQKTDNKNKLLVIKINDLDSLKQKVVDITTTINNIDTKEEFEYTPGYSGFDSDNIEYENDSNSFSIDFTNNKLNAIFNTIKFEPIAQFEKGHIKHRLENADEPYEAITIDDQRINKNGLKVFLTQDYNFTSRENHVLPASLRFYKDGEFTNPFQQSTLVYESLKDNLVDSIKWSHNSGLLLHVDADILPTGDYFTQLSWNIVDTI